MKKEKKQDQDSLKSKKMSVNVHVKGAVLPYENIPLEFAYLLWVLLRCCYSYLKEGRFRYRPLHIALDIGVLAAVLIWWVLRNLI